MVDETYPGGAEALIAHWEKRRAALGFGPGEALPALDADLGWFAAQKVGNVPAGRSSFAVKRAALAAELVGFSELALLNAALISCLRKRHWPEHAPALFCRIWAEQGAALIAELPLRWLISSAITFADHGPTEADRKVGQSLNILFSMMKIYEFERTFGGTAPDKAFGIGKRVKAPLPMGMQDFSLASGGLDINLLAPIWRDARAAGAVGPLACHLLEELNRDAGTVFRRLSTMRAAKQARMAAKA